MTVRIDSAKLRPELCIKILTMEAIMTPHKPMTIKEPMAVRSLLVV